MALTKLYGTKFLKLNTVEGAKTTNATGEGQIGSATINTFNITNSAVTPAKVLATGDFTVNSVTTTANVSVGANAVVTGAVSSATLAVSTDKFTVDASGNTAIAGTLTVTGNFQVDGTTTTVNSTTLDVVDKNITVAKGGNAAAAEGAGLTVSISDGTNGSLVYKASSESKFALGLVGAEDNVVTKTITQTLTNKTLTLLTPLTVNAVVKTTVEDALIALNNVLGNAAGTLYTDDSAVIGGTLTVAGATSITAVYMSGIRLSQGEGNDYIVVDNEITFSETVLSGVNIVVDYK